MHGSRALASTKRIESGVSGQQHASSPVPHARIRFAPSSICIWSSVQSPSVPVQFRIPSGLTSPVCAPSEQRADSFVGFHDRSAGTLVIVGAIGEDTLQWPAGRAGKGHDARTPIRPERRTADSRREFVSRRALKGMATMSTASLEMLLRFAVEHGASDLHIQAGSKPMLRIAGQMRAVETAVLSHDDTRDILASIVPDVPREELDSHAIRGLDFSRMIHGLSRFRCSAYKQKGEIGIVIRVIPLVLADWESLHLPDVIRDIALSRRGMTLVTGTTGSGKNTTLAAMVDLINNQYRFKIITIEDPIEHVHGNKKALISQLEVGSDTPSFEQAMRQALRQDPDVILVGELRDVETLRIALRAADTGHQVLSTVHTANAAQTVERIIAMFPASEHTLLLKQLAESIEAIISQRLVATRDGSRRPAVEILRGNPASKKLILENRLAELHDYMKTGETGMQTFDQHLLSLYQQEVISGTEALRWASNPEAVAMEMRGVHHLVRGRG